jgi:hypothetical protein
MIPFQVDHRVRIMSRRATVIDGAILIDGLGLLQKLRQLGDIRRDPSRLILAEQFYNARPPVACRELLLTIG